MLLNLDNIIFSLQRTGGISVYWYELISRIIASEHAPQYFNLKKNNNIFGNQLIDKIRPVEESMLPTYALKYLPFHHALKAGSIFHSSFLRVSLQKNITNVLTIHDLIYEKKFIRGAGRFVNMEQKRFALNNADHIICVSENTKHDLLEFYPFTMEKEITVIHNGVSSDYFPTTDPFSSSKFLIEPYKYILYVGGRSNYKNFELAVDIVSALSDYTLVLVGGKTMHTKEYELLSTKLPNRFRLFQSISSEDLNLLYNSAFCLLYPSNYEGFGIPVVEAMRAGCPVVALNTSLIPEVAGDAALLASEPSLEEFCSLIHLLTNFKFRNIQINSGFKQAALFSWDTCFENTLDVYKQAHSGLV
ncbi:MAG: glycosyltransferase family 4 protein [Cytophagaceae bacterium]|nr:glycosyltransferase family 4 protein [Cytophagaceae bacterium]